MTWSSALLVPMALVLVCLISVAAARRRDACRRTATIGLILMIGTIATIAVLASVGAGQDQADDFLAVDLDVETAFPLVLDSNYGHPRLLDDEGNEVRYLMADGSISTASSYHPVYLRHFEAFDVVVFSVNPVVGITGDRYVFPDYRYEDSMEDRLYVIVHENGWMIPVSSYDLIGSAVDLASFHQSGDDNFSFVLYQRHARSIAAVAIVESARYDEVMPEQIPPHLRHRELIVTDIHFYTSGDPSEITRFAVGSNASLWADSYGEVRAFWFVDSVLGIDVMPVTSSLFVDTLVSSGYVVERNEDVYYVGRSVDALGYSLYRIESASSVSEVHRYPGTAIPDLAEWMDAIPE
ncbi:MAG: hypothetical protein WC509_05225 [Candidatus Izemoplasmatales bacterium]